MVTKQLAGLVPDSIKTFHFVSILLTQHFLNQVITDETLHETNNKEQLLNRKFTLITEDAQISFLCLMADEDLFPWVSNSIFSLYVACGKILRQTQTGRELQSEPVLTETNRFIIKLFQANESKVELVLWCRALCCFYSYRQRVKPDGQKLRNLLIKSSDFPVAW